MVSYAIRIFIFARPLRCYWKGTTSRIVYNSNIVHLCTKCAKNRHFSGRSDSSSAFVGLQYIKAEVLGPKWHKLPNSCVLLSSGCRCCCQKSSGDYERSSAETGDGNYDVAYDINDYLTPETTAYSLATSETVDYENALTINGANYDRLTADNLYNTATIIQHNYIKLLTSNRRMISWFFRDFYWLYCKLNWMYRV